MSRDKAGSEKVAAHAEAQRGRILDAAQQCFIADGFHAAAMATIAERAGMSAGLIYRYFENKDAIVLAIIERELQLRRSRIATLHGSVDLAAGLVETFEELRSAAPGVVNAALFLEMSAEATRIESIGGAVRHADRSLRAEFESFLARDPSHGGLGLGAEDAADGALFVQVLAEGMAVRAAREPELDAASLRRALTRFIPWGPRDATSAA